MALGRRWKPLQGVPHQSEPDMTDRQKATTDPSLDDLHRQGTGLVPALRLCADACRALDVQTCLVAARAVGVFGPVRARLFAISMFVTVLLLVQLIPRLSEARTRFALCLSEAR